jgi:ribosomal protein L7Ae-like RNA K-turn-binding protein
LEAKSKVETFIGFAIRTGKYRIGLNACLTLKKANLVLVCNSASENTVKDAIKLAKRFNCPILTPINKKLEDITFRENAKVMAIADKDLSKAIIDNSQNEFIARI